MPLPPITYSNAPAAVGRHVFVSYSHKDYKLAQDVVDALYALAGNAEELGLARERIFFDSARLTAGDRWSEQIDNALQLADVMLFLVSTASLNSAYCISDELGVAVAHGKTIVPVLLSPTPEWENRKLPGDPAGQRLGSLQGVPSDNGRLHPISGGPWANRSVALERTMQGIARLLRRDAPAAPATAPAATAGGPRRALPPMLPSLCNQMASVLSFDNGLDAWPAERALMVLLKGEFADHTSGFWDRVRLTQLADYCEQVLGRPLREPRPLLLPSAADAGGDATALRVAVRRQLSEALTGRPRALPNGEALATLLAADDGVRLLEVILPQDTADNTAPLLQALLAVLDDVPAGAALGRLGLGVLIEEPSLVAEERLVQRLALAPARTHLFETRRLQLLTGDEVRRWHRAHDLGPVVGLDEERFVQRVFGDAAQLRHLTFDQRVRPLLGLAREESER